MDVRNSESDTSDQEQINLNAQLFVAIRHRSLTEDAKLQSIAQLLDEGANVNAQDANNRNNSALHVAAIKGDSSIVLLLLSRGAKLDGRNRKKQTALDVAKDVGIQLILRGPIVDEPVTSPELVAVADQSVQKCERNLEVSKTSPTLLYRKRAGTAGISGQLYETKLLSLVLVRAMFSEDIEEFYLGTNIDGIGALDDLVLRYTTKQGQTHMAFVQAKHRDNPKKAKKLTLEEAMGENGDFSLAKYFQSYLEIVHKFSSNDELVLFQNNLEKLNYEFILYTPAMEKIDRKTQAQEISCLSTGGTQFRFNYEEQHVESLVEISTTFRINLLAENLARYIISGKTKELMKNKFVKRYHVALARNVLKVSKCEATFRDEFFKTTDHLTILFRESLYKEVLSTATATSKAIVKQHVAETLADPTAETLCNLIGTVLIVDKNASTLKLMLLKESPEFSGLQQILQQQEIMKNAISIAGRNRLKPMRLQVSEIFGNFDLPKATNHENLATKFEELCKGTNNIIDITASMIGPNGVLKKCDIKHKGGIAGMVGNLLIADDQDTKLLKFNCDITCLGTNATKMFNVLRSRLGDRINSLRFNIKLEGFPQLSYGKTDEERVAAQNFLDHLTFYTNQATEHEIDVFLKEELRKPCPEIDSVHLDALVLRFHDRVQKWWKKPGKAEILTKQCNFINQAIHQTIYSSLLSNISLICKKQVNKRNIQFKQNIVNQLIVQIKEGITNIETHHLELSCIQVLQCFEQNDSIIFISTDYWDIASEPLRKVLQEEDASRCVLILSKSNKINFPEFFSSFKSSQVISRKNVVIVSEGKISSGFSTVTEVEFEFDGLTEESQAELLSNTNVVFQDKQLDEKLKTLLDGSTSHRMKIDGEMLSLLVSNSSLEIATPAKSLYDEKYLIDRTLVRRKIILKPNYRDSEDSKQDLWADSTEMFMQMCEEHKTRNIHLMKREHSKPVWQQTRGSLFNLRNNIAEMLQGEEYKLKEMEVHEDRIVVIAAEPGMGKSVMLNELASWMRQINPLIWVVKIDLLMQSKQLLQWETSKTVIGIEAAIQFLINSFSLADEKLKSPFEILLENDQIILKNINMKSSTLFEANLFIHLYNQGRVVVLLDGFDEINPHYKREVLQLLHVLMNSKVSTLWITTRNDNNHHELEDKLGTFSHALKPFSEEDQLDYLRKFWCANPVLSGLEESRFSNFSSALVENFSKMISKTEKEFMGIPLQMRMIATVFQRDFELFYSSGRNELSDECAQSLSKSLNLVSLYDEFFRIKFDEILYGEKRSNWPKCDPEIRDTLEERRQLIIARHEQLALCAFLSHRQCKEWLSKEERSKLLRNVQVGEEKLGLVCRIDGDKPIFAHKTYGEYFLARFLWEKFLKVPSADCAGFIERSFVEVLITKELYQVCYFLQLMAQRDFDRQVEPSEIEPKLRTLVKSIVKCIPSTYRVHFHVEKTNCPTILLKIVETYLSNLENGTESFSQLIQELDVDLRHRLLHTVCGAGYTKLLRCFIGLVNLKQHIASTSWHRSSLAKLYINEQVLEILKEAFALNASWTDRFGQTFKGYIMDSFNTNAVEICLNVGLEMDGDLFEDYESYLQLPLLAALQRLAPTRIVEMIAERTSIERLNTFKFRGERASNLLAVYMLKYDVIGYFSTKGVDLTQAVNFLLSKFNYHSIASHTLINDVNCEWSLLLDKIEWDKLYDKLKQFLKSGVGYNRKDGEFKFSSRQYVYQLHYIHKLIRNIIGLNGKDTNPLDTILKLIVIGMKSDHAEQASEAHLLICPESKKISLISMDLNKAVRKYSEKGALSIEDTENGLSIRTDFCDDRTMKTLETCVDEWSKNKINTLRYYLKKQLAPKGRPELEVIEQIGYLCEFDDDAFQEILENSRNAVQRYENMLNVENDIKLYATDKIVSILNLNNIHVTQEMENSTLEIVKNGGLPLLREMWLALNSFGLKRVAWARIQDIPKLSEQSSRLNELFTNFDECYYKLMAAIETKDTTVTDVLNCIESDFRASVVNGQDGDYGSPLHFAAYKGNLQAVEALLQLGADPNNDLVEDGILQYLQRPEAAVPIELKHATPLHLAAIHGHHEVVKRLHLKGAHVNVQTESGRSPLYFAIAHDHKRVVRSIISAEGMKSVGYLWATLSQEERHTIMERLQTMLPDESSEIVSVSSHLNRCYGELIHAISRYRLVDQVLNQVGSTFEKALVTAQDDDRGSPLHFAAAIGHLRVVQRLMKSGADPNLKLQTETAPGLPVPDEVSNGMKHFTPLHLATIQGHNKVVAELIQNDSTKIDTTTASGWTALHFAERFGRIDAAKLLIRHGANREAVTLEHDTPLSITDKWCPSEKKEDMRFVISTKPLNWLIRNL